MSGFTSTIATNHLIVWGIALLFVSGALIRSRQERLGRVVEASGWLAFGVFWLVALPQPPIITHSPLSAFETLLTQKGRLYVAFLAGPLCGYLAYLTWQDSPGFQPLARVVAIASLIYVPAITLRAVQRLLIDTTVSAVTAIITPLNGTPQLIAGPSGFQNTFQFITPTGHIFDVHVLLACTGIGSLAMATGLVAGINGPLHRKIKILSVALPTIYVANIARIVFIGIASGDQLLQLAPHLTMSLFGTQDPYMVSYILSDHIISQILSVTILIGLLIYAFRMLPMLARLVENVINSTLRTHLQIRSTLR